MKVPAIISCAVLGAAFLLAPSAEAHHSNSAFYVTKVITIKGVVKEFQWGNPHVWVILTVDDGKGNKVDWKVEGRPPGVLIACRLDAEGAAAWRRDHGRLESGEGRHGIRPDCARDEGRRHDSCQRAAADGIEDCHEFAKIATGI